MKVAVTEALQVNLDTETWECRKCGHEHGPASEQYKKLLKLRARNPREVHRTIIDPEKYDHTFAPKPEWVNIVEFYCPSCALLVEAEYLPPGHPPVHDIELNLDALRQSAQASQETEEAGA